MAEVLSVPQQYATVRGTTGLPTYKAFMDKFFVDHGAWGVQVDKLQNPQDGELSADYFRFLGLVGIVTAQFGFPSLEGQVQRHKFKKWQNPVTSPQHQLATGIYMARLNEQTYDVKDKLVTKLGKAPFAPAAWNLYTLVSNGVADPIEDYSLREIRAAARERFREERPIFEPDRNLNSRLAAIEFTGHDADRMSPEEFGTQVFPEVVDIFTPDDPANLLLDPIPVFTQRLSTNASMFA